MAWNLFIDNELMPPEDGHTWVIARTHAQAMVEIIDRGMPSYISFDYDLGETTTNYDTAKEIVAMDMNATDAKYKFPVDFAFDVHSQDPVGKENIEAYLNNYLAQKG